MKNILIVMAHPSSRNMTRKIAKIYSRTRQTKGDKVEVVDLYADEQLPFLRFDDANEQSTSEDVRYYQEKIAKADKIVFVAPFWWGGPPAIMKNWIDSVLTKDFAFTYVDGRPKGLLEGKSARVFMTCGAPKFYYVITGMHFAVKKIWKQAIITFCGMEFEGFHLFGGVDTSGKEVEKIFSTVQKIAEEN